MNILFVDDQPQSIKTTLDLIRNEAVAGSLPVRPNEIHLVSTIEDAKKFLKEKKADLVFLDIRFGNDSGLSLAPEINGCGAIFAAITGVKKRDTEIECHKLGAFAVFHKPVEYEELTSFIRLVDKFGSRLKRARRQTYLFFGTPFVFLAATAITQSAMILSIVIFGWVFVLGAIVGWWGDNLKAFQKLVGMSKAE